MRSFERPESTRDGGMEDERSDIRDDQARRERRDSDITRPRQQMTKSRGSNMEGNGKGTREELICQALALCRGGEE